MIARFALLSGPRGSHTAENRPPPVGADVANLGDLVLITPRAAPPKIFPGRDGLVVGTLFDRDGHPVSAIGASAARAIVETAGASATAQWWGDYVVAWRDAADRRWRILRAPGGGLQAFCMHDGDRPIVFSDLAFAREVRPTLTTAVDWEAIAYGLQYEGLDVERTALQGVREITPGQRCNLAGGNHRSLWSLDDFVARRGDERDVEAATLAHAIQIAVRAFAGAGPVVLELSGGLDSSVLAACLAGTPDARGVTVFTPTADGDERAYARAVARRCGLSLDEIVVEAIDLLDAGDVAAVRPTGRSYLGTLDRLLAAHAAGIGACGVMTGGGGDSVFRRSGSPLAVIDALLDDGWWRALRCVRDLACLTDTDLFRVGLATLRAVPRAMQRRWSPSPHRGLLARDAFLKFAGHPALETSTSLPGARSHAALIVRALAGRHGMSRGDALPLSFPLLAQPVIEAALAFPSWRWIEAGRDRAVVRAAFADTLPTDILQRRTKGRLESLVGAAFARGFADIAGLLEEGALVGQGVVDRAALHASLARARRSQEVDFDLLSLIDAETWLAGIVRREPGL